MYRYFSLFIFVLLICSTAWAQQKVTITGSVFNKDNEPMIGANVYLNGTTIGTATNANGQFQLKSVKPNEYQLCVSFSGHKKYRQLIDASKNITKLSVTMQTSRGNLGEVVVTGTGTPHHLKTAPVPTELITSKMIEKIAAPDFINLMGAVSPSFDFSPSTMGSFMQLNGLSNDFIVVLINGRRVYGDMGGMNDLGRINPNSIERIEVVKGASSSLYGSDAIAGVVNIITKKSNRSFAISNNTQYSNYNSLQQTNSIDFNTKRVSGHTTFSQKHCDGWQNSPYEYNKNDSLVETNYKTQNSYMNRNIRQDLEFRISDKLSVNSGISYYVNDITMPTEVKDYGYFFEDLSYNLEAKYLLSKQSNIFFNYASDTYKYYYKYNKDDDNGDYIENELKLNNDQQRQDYNLGWITKIGSNQNITLGSELVNETYRSQYRLENGIAQVNTISFYAQDEITLLKDIVLTAGVRVVSHDNFGAITTPKLSVLYKLNNYNLRGTYSCGFKAPTLKEQYYFYEKRGTLYLGNTNLDPQKSNYFSLGVDYHNKWMGISISTYQNDINGLIIYQTVDTLPGDAENGIKKRRQHANIENARTKGADIMLDIKLPYGFTIGGGYSYVDAQNLTDTVRLEYVAQNYANIRAGYYHGWNKYRLNVQLLGRLQDEKYFEDENAKVYNLWKLTTTHEMAEFAGVNFIAILGVDNIFNYIDDSPFGSHYGTINPGRTFFVGLNIQFAK